MEEITFATRTEYSFTFTEFFDIFFYNDTKRYSYARRVWEKMIDRIGGTHCEFSDEVGFSDFKEVITTLKIDAESDTYETDSEDSKSEASEDPEDEESVEIAEYNSGFNSEKE